jgi:hypothetical protein
LKIVVYRRDQPDLVTANEVRQSLLVKCRLAAAKLVSLVPAYVEQRPAAKLSQALRLRRNA